METLFTLFISRRIFPFPAVIGKIDLGHKLAKPPDPISLRLALASGTILSTTARASDLVISLTRPITRLLRLRSTHHIATQRPRCFLTDPFWYRLLRIEFSLCAFPGTPYWQFRMVASAVSTVHCSRSRAAAFLGVSAFGDQGTQQVLQGSPATRPATALQTCAFEQ